MSKSWTRSATYTQPSAQGLFDVAGEYLANMLKKQNGDQILHHSTNSLHSRNQPPQIGQSDIPLSNSSINWMQEKFGEQNTIVIVSDPNYHSMKSPTFSEFPVLKSQGQKINNDLTKSMVTKEIAQVLKEMGFHTPIDCTLGNVSVDELKHYCDLHSSSFDNECIMEIVGALLG